MQDLVLNCPHCMDMFIVDILHLNCMIFRHAVFKDTLLHIDPHATEIMCNVLLRENRIYGCARPFRVVSDGSNGYRTEKCDYI